MSDLRRRKLLTFRIEKTDSQPLPPVKKYLLQSSPVYTRRALDIGLSPRLIRQAADLRALDWQRYKWNVSPANTSSIMKFSQKSSKCRPPKGQITLTKPNNEANHTDNDGDKENITHFSTSRSLPLMPVNRLGQSMLRRPTVQGTRSVRQDEDLFEMLIKGDKLKPFSFMGDSLRAIEFYSSHYPLLLKKMVKRSLPGSAKPLTETDVIEYLRISSPVRRSQEVHQRINRTEDSLKEFENEDDGPIITELRSDPFDPSKWAWNLEKYKLPSLNQ